MQSKNKDSGKLQSLDIASLSKLPKNNVNNKESASKLYIERVTNADFSSPINELVNRRSTFNETGQFKSKGSLKDIAFNDDFIEDLEVV